MVLDNSPCGQTSLPAGVMKTCLPSGCKENGAPKQSDGSRTRSCCPGACSARASSLSSVPILTNRRRDLFID
jgi:hypothetical protein